MRINIKKGFDIPIAGVADQCIDTGAACSHVAVLGSDYPGLRPALHVREGDKVRLGDPLFRDKRTPRVQFPAPGCGVVESVVHGQRRVLQAVIIRLDGADVKSVAAVPRDGIDGLDSGALRDLLLESGAWTALRTRPYDRIPDPASTPRSIFVTAMDTNPLAADPCVVIGEQPEQFMDGLRAVARLGARDVYVCTAPGAAVPVPDDPCFHRVEFAGPHPAGLAGTHIHFLDPVGADRTVWYLNYQDVMSIARTLERGWLDTERVVSLAGPRVLRPRLVRTRLGASTVDLVRDELAPGDCRIVSGSVLNGHRATGWARFLGRFHLQISALAEGHPREFLGWLAPGRQRVSAIRAFASALFPGRRFSLDTAQNGSPRAMVPIGSYERVMPLDILPAPLLKALVVRDTETASALGCLELSEEDVALLSYVDCGKYDFGPILRENLQQIERDE